MVEAQLGDGGHVDGVWLRVRFPRRESRHTLRPPEDTSMGAVPLNAAKQSRVGKRAMSPVMPTTVAATTGPTPKMSMTLVRDAATTWERRFFDSASWRSTRRRSSSSSCASSTRAAATALSASTSASSEAALSA